MEIFAKIFRKVFFLFQRQHKLKWLRAAMDERQAKRRRLDYDDALQVSEPIRTVQDLKEALYFRQNQSREAKQGIRRFKDFLSSISFSESTAEQVSKLKVLKEYCDGQFSTEKYAPTFPDLISTWSFAAEHKNDALLSAVPAVLAQFLKTISSFLEFRDFGISVCRTLLQRDQLRLLERGLSAPLGKEFVISPCLRLLTEVVSLDGGVVAQDVFAKRDPLLKRLDVFLSEAPASISDDEEKDWSRPTLRRIAQRFVLANLKFLDGAARTELILQGKILHSFLRSIDTDASDIIRDILRAIDKRIVSDESITRSIKNRFLNASNLTSLVRLYGYEDRSSEADTDISVRDSIHQFLLRVCTQAGKGLLVPQSGWYPAGINAQYRKDTISNSDLIDLGLHSLEHFDDYQDSVPVKNGTLSTFLKSLRPEKDRLQADLLLKTFEAAPELVADYFTKKTRFVSSPKDDPEWLGQFAFLFSTIQLPVPALGDSTEMPPTRPPPLSIVIESILPRPFDRTMLTKCLNLNQELFTMSAARVLTVSLKKLEDTVRAFHTAGKTDSTLWLHASEKLVEIFMQRTPLVKDIATALQRQPKENLRLRGTMAECLATYITVVPESANAVKFDATKALGEILQNLNDDELGTDAQHDLIEQLPEYLAIAANLPSTRWFQFSSSTVMSPLTLLLRFCTSSGTTPAVSDKVDKLLKSVLMSKGILSAELMSYKALVASLKASKKWTTETDTFLFLENCMVRVVQHPVRYLDILEGTPKAVSDVKSLSLLACAVAEQWPFVAKNSNKDARKNIAAWVARFFSALEQIGENFRVIAALQQRMLQDSGEKLRTMLQKAFDKQPKKPIVVESTPGDGKARNLPEGDVVPIDENLPLTAEGLDAAFGPPIAVPTSMEGLDRWDQADLDAAIANGRVGRLLRCAAGPEEEARRQALITIQSLMRTVQTSNYAFKEQLHLLLGEFTETMKAHSADFSRPLPSVTTELAVLIVRVLNDPADRMYGKVNSFLLKGPVWDSDRIIGYWIDHILLSEPENEDGHHLEVDRLLTMLRDGLRGPQDLELYRRAGVWERVLGLYESPQCTKAARRNVLGILWRTMGMGENQEGKAMLVRRAGISGWLRAMRCRSSKNDGETDVLQALVKEMEGVEDTADLMTWKDVYRRKT